MKRYIAYILSAAIFLLTSCQKGGSDTTVRLSAAGSDFVNNEAELIVALANRIDSPVSVELSVSGTLPKENLSLNRRISIAAGDDAITVPVYVQNADALGAGKYTATFTISAVDGAKLDHRNKSVSLNLTVEAKPQNNN